MSLNSADVSALEAVRALVLGSGMPIPTDLHCPVSAFQGTQEGHTVSHRPRKGQDI